MVITLTTQSDNVTSQIDKSAIIPTMNQNIINFIRLIITPKWQSFGGSTVKWRDCVVLWQITRWLLQWSHCWFSRDLHCEIMTTIKFSLDHILRHHFFFRLLLVALQERGIFLDMLIACSGKNYFFLILCALLPNLWWAIKSSQLTIEPL